MKVIITFTFCCDNLWKSKFLALEKPGKLGIFFSYFVATLKLQFCTCMMYSNDHEHSAVTDVCDVCNVQLFAVLEEA